MMGRYLVKLIESDRRQSYWMPIPVVKTDGSGNRCRDEMSFGDAIQLCRTKNEQLKQLTLEETIETETVDTTTD